MKIYSTAAAIAVACVVATGLGCAARQPRSIERAAVQRPVQPLAPTKFISADSAPEQDVRVMSFNLRVPFVLDHVNHWEFRKALLVRTIRDFAPDVLGTQECVSSVADHLRDQLPEYRFIGAGRNDGRRSGEMCAIFYKDATFEELDSGHFWLSKRPDEPGSRSWGTWFTRMASWVKLQRRDDGRVFYFFNTHLDSNSSNARLEGARLVRSRMAAIAGDAPAILVGDFNTDENTAPYNALVGVGKLVDTYRQMHAKPSGHDGSFHKFRGGQGGDRIDWIVATPGVITRSAEIDHASDGWRYPSDHFPVIAVVNLPRPVVPLASREPVAPVLPIVPPTLQQAAPIVR